MVDKNGKQFFKNSLIYFHAKTVADQCAHCRPEFWISKIEEIEIYPTGDVHSKKYGGVLSLCDGWKRNFSEVEVVTKEQAILLKLQDGNIKLKF